MKNVTFRVEESLLEAARLRARSEGSTLNEQFGLWLARNAHAERMRRYDDVVRQLRGKLDLGGRKVTRCTLTRAAGSADRGKEDSESD